MSILDSAAGEARRACLPPSDAPWLRGAPANGGDVRVLPTRKRLGPLPGGRTDPYLTARMYCRTFGWDVKESRGRLTMRTGSGMIAVGIAAVVAPVVANALRALDADAPALSYRAQRRWVFLADCNDLVVADIDLPDWVYPLSLASELEIPASDGGADGIRWAVAPNPQRRWLPTLAVVLDCARRCDRVVSQPDRVFPPLAPIKRA